ncbi:MAG: phosphotransferase, partial [Candidatus Thiodiazotropha sp. (ex Lucinoma borealis)]|nr:phosphotransferase [Candidatus Thiodiazotropha sp. (ex Lucinoma borealis)]
MTPNAEDLDLQHHLIQQLLKSPACFGHTLDQVEHIETHISHLLLVGETVYKIKKPLNLGFLDFSTLEKRRLCCEEELRLNRRLAPTLYLDVVGIGGSIEQPIMNADSGILEYAVRMRRFRQQDLLNITLPDRDMIERLAVLIADFHQMIPAVSEEMPYGKPNNVFKPMEENFQLIRGLKQPLLEIERLNILQTWTEQQASVLEPLMEERYQSGHIRECHGDLHLGNIALFEGRITPFDGIEFNP